MNMSDYSKERIDEVNIIKHEFRNINTDETVLVVDEILENRFETEAYVDNTVINVER